MASLDLSSITEKIDATVVVGGAAYYYAITNDEVKKMIPKNAITDYILQNPEMATIAAVALYISQQ